MSKEELEKEAEEYAEGMAKYYASTHEDCIPSQFEKYLRNAYISSAEPREKRIAELEKENAELKKKNLDTQDAVTMQMYTNKANKEIADRQLTKAKEIIKHLLDWQYDEYKSSETDKELFKVIGEAEQFLNSEVEK